MCRDRYGEKPFFFYKKNNYLYLKPHQAHWKQLATQFFNYDNSSISDFVNFGHTSNSKTIFDKVFKLPLVVILITQRINLHFTNIII